MLNSSAFIDKTEMIENDIRDNCNRQAVKALRMWTNGFGDEANQAAMIRACVALVADLRLKMFLVPVWCSMSAHTNDCVVLTRRQKVLLK